MAGDGGAGRVGAARRSSLGGLQVAAATATDDDEPRHSISRTGRPRPTHAERHGPEVREGGTYGEVRSGRRGGKG